MSEDLKNKKSDYLLELALEELKKRKRQKNIPICG